MISHRRLASLLAALILSSCATSTPSFNKLKVGPIDPRLAQACPSPQSFLQGSYPQIVGQMGVALIECGKRHKAVVADDVRLRKAINQ